jgi:putative transposase
VTLFVDDYSRAIMGWAISLQPSSAEVLAALRDALVVQPGRGPFGGVPGRLRWDHGLEFTAGAVEHAALALVVDVDPATPYAPHEKGKIERLHLTIAETFIAMLPGYTDAPRDVRGCLEDSGELLLLAQLVVEAFAARALAYNGERPHRSLGGLTPEQRFAADPTPLRLVAPEDARALLTARRSGDGAPRRCASRRAAVRRRRVDRAGRRERRDRVRATRPTLDRGYWRGAWLCTAIPHDALSAAQQAQIMAGRRAYAGELRRRQRRATRRARGRLAPATAQQPDPPEVTRLPERALDAPEHRGPRDEQLRAAAPTDLLLPAPGPPQVREQR